MLKPIEINFKLDKTIKRALTTELMIKSHDINVIEFHISFDGLELTADHTVKVLSVFSDTGSQTNVNCEIADGKAIYRPDTSIISQYDYVRNYVYVYHGDQSLDAHLFTYSVDSSKIDKTTIKVKTVYDQSYAELLTEFEARLQDYKDSLPQASDLRAEVDVILNKFKVDSDAKLSQYDADAQQVIADNQTAFDSAESNRQSTYEQAEDSRNQVSEQAVSDWEQSADAIINMVEDNESARVDAETTRKSSETTRVSNEIERESAEDVRQANELLREANYEQLIDTALIEADVVKKVDNKVTELTPQINDLTAQLAQKADKSATFANAKNRLKIMNYLENIDNIHPKVLYFEEGWNEWKYWMAYTPYPGGRTENENPSIAVSRDGINWTTPDGLVNPVEPMPDNGYNSDTHLVMNNGTMELWWRSAFPEGGSRDTIIYRRTSNDGVNWSNREEMLNSVSYGGDILSPAIIVEDGRYKMWGCRSGQVVYNESNDGSSWNKENEMTLNINWGSLTAWHMDVIHTDEGYELLVQAYSPGGGNNFSSLYHVKSQDNASFSEPIMVMKPSTGSSWDNQGIYRSSFVKISGVYYVFYCAVSSNNRRAISLSVGEELTALKGYENTGTFDKSAYSVDDELGLRLSNPILLPSGFQERGTYIQTSNLPSTAKIAGASRGREYVGGLEVSNIYIVDKEESARLPLDIIRGTLRRDGMGLQMYDGNAWKRINDSREVLTIRGAQDIDVMDLSDVKSIVFTGTGTVTITGFSGGNRYEETDLYIDSSSISVIIKDGNGVINPDREDFVLNQSKVNCRVVRMASSRWRIYE